MKNRFFIFSLWLVANVALYSNDLDLGDIDLAAAEHVGVLPVTNDVLSKENDIVVNAKTGEPYTGVVYRVGAGGGFIREKVINGIGFGIIERINQSGKVTMRAFQENGTLTGYYRLYDESGQNLVEEGYYADGAKNGLWVFWYPNGNRKAVIEYSKGKKDGISLRYNPAGLLEEKSIFEDGLEVNSDDK
ncbi:toxin-antitoxin system YwqK family antitoxin [Cerasicoccus arenae]|uniref:Toxin-antitoxin system YwqK family antitoxin n=1 Tax=Cerasicoccus arenae TaxID=424488 RepID=A0A8J3GFS1_9BACT|nr:hypothetical protein [Cerasicoccus arenae]MBK1860072.1 hypothetical protein [Cerasicoccus arenae]GHC14080.1 hypothetical protein GCM10007047_34170 [Cerasicoccus arenae]